MNQPLQLAIATGANWATLNPEDQALVALLEREDIRCTTCVWTDPAIDWACFDAVLIRSIWDYFQLYPAYLAWLERLHADGVRTLNPLEVLRWNSDKRYLLQLEQAGIAIASTLQWRGAELVDALATADPQRELIVKPAVSGGAWHTVRGRPGSPEFVTALSALPADLDFLVQPFLPEIAAAGEWSLLYFGADSDVSVEASFSHAVLKRPASGDYRVQAQFGGSTETLPPPSAIRGAADAALRASLALLDTALTYARVDGVWVDGRFLLMEIELIEPYLFLTERAGAAEQLAAVIVRSLRAAR